MRRLLAALCAALLLALTACTPRSQTPERHELTYLDVFDTVTTLVAYGGTGEDFSAEAGRIHAELLDYHRLYDIYNDYPGLNNLKTVNDRAGEAPVEVDRRIIDLLLEAREMYGVTGGKVNVAFGSVLSIWHDYREAGILDPERAALPPMEALRAAAEQCRAVGAVLAVDECFLPLSDGAGPGLAPCLAEYPNLLLLRAFTKSYAMAGLRLGYALSANGGLLERMAAAGPPWSVSTPAQAAGLAALEQCPDWPGKARALLASERPALSDGLCALGLEVVPGQANYLLFRSAGAADLKERMLTRGVLIRSCANYHGLGNDWYRVCVGQAEQNRRLLAALKEVL